MIDPRNDPRSVDELVNAFLCESDEDLAWNYVSALHWKGTAEVLNWAASLCKSTCSKERRFGADILGQLGVPKRTFPNECAAILLEMLNAEADVNVLRSIFVAFGHLHDSRIVAVAESYASHVDPVVRHAVALALTDHEEDTAINLLVRLTADPSPLVRDWATFGLGTQMDTDTPEIRSALLARLDDEDDDTRAEAQMGLAIRGDRRVIPAIAAELQKSTIGMLTIDAAETIAAPELLPYLEALREAEVDTFWLNSAIEACATNSTNHQA